MLSGYPGSQGVNVEAVTSTGKTALLAVSSQPREKWQRIMLEIPSEVAKEGYRLRISDQSGDHFGWAGLGQLIDRPPIALADGMLPMLVSALIGNAWLIAITLCLSATVPPRDRLLQGMLVGGCIWFLIFLGYVISSALGKALALLLLTLPFLLALMKCWRRPNSLTEIGSLQTALLPTFVLACMVLWIGLFPFHWEGQVNGDPALRWTHLSTDAWLPLLFGDMLAHGRLDVPMVGDWLSSDRPPLQVGLYLMLYNLMPDSQALVYQGISSWAQALTLLPVAALLAKFMSKRAQAVALIALSLSALMLLNTLFVWPKLLAGGFSLIYYIALFPAQDKPKRWGQAGISAALALLSHGGALFFIVGAALVHLCWYRRRSLIMLLQTGLTVVALYLPWVAYQRFIDPPGDRLIKWQFAGKIPVSDESAASAIFSAYSQLTPELWLSARLQNLSVIFKGALSVPYDAWIVITRQNPSFVSRFIDDDFFYLFHSLWFASPLLLLPCLAVLYWRSRRQADLALKSLLQALASLIITTLVWVTAIFEGGATTVHIGAYASVLLLHIIVLSVVWRTSAPLFYTICLFNICVALSAYVFDRHFLPGLQSTYVLAILLMSVGFVAAVFSASGCLRWQNKPTHAGAYT